MSRRMYYIMTDARMQEVFCKFLINTKTVAGYRANAYNGKLRRQDMADIYDYLGWQGHIPFAQAAVNEADFLILSWLAYVDWQKQSNQFGTEAERMAAAGMTGTGFSESSQVGMYNAYQNRVAVARESFGQAVVNYNNAITSARVQNNSALAEIALDALAQQSELIIQGFGYKNDLILQQANQKINLQNTYWQREFDILKQRDANIQAEVNRQWQAKESKLQREWQEKQDALERQHDKDMLKAKTEAEKEVADYNYAIEKKRLEDEYKAKLEYEKALADYELQKKLDMITKDTDEVGAGGSGSGSKLGGQSYKETSDALVRALGYDARANNHVNQAKTPFSGTTYDSAVSYLKSQGKTVGSLMTASEWSRRRNSYSMTGQGAAEVTKFSSYADYIQAFVQARMDGYGG